MNQIGLLGTAAYWQMRVNLAKTKNRIPTRDSHKQEAPHGHLVHSNKAGNSVGTDGEGLSNIMELEALIFAVDLVMGVDGSLVCPCEEHLETWGLA